MIRIGDIVKFNEENKMYAPEFGFKDDKGYTVVESYPLYNTIQIVNEYSKSVTFHVDRLNKIV